MDARRKRLALDVKTCKPHRLLWRTNSTSGLQTAGKASIQGCRGALNRPGAAVLAGTATVEFAAHLQMKRNYLPTIPSATFKLTCSRELWNQRPKQGKSVGRYQEDVTFCCQDFVQQLFVCASSCTCHPCSVPAGKLCHLN